MKERRENQSVFCTNKTESELFHAPLGTCCYTKISLCSNSKFLSFKDYFLFVETGLNLKTAYSSAI